ncbi:GDSL esterase/lipase [Raphanus sativus]|uniref:GDSL esterase/lipase At2g31540-like n=1 Tax=Raphanus sativus TaxID=3726 RepID=A0A6J0K3E9_RAPSA|nr:GDSL esterase/lipase At2g31540-like [Raphanus sativus]KAJ4891404.1 GDSL esterase/lipase [Raphanus sativus]
MSSSKTITFTLFIATTLFASCNAAANATTKPLFPAILIFGDSTVDTGNNNYPLNTFFRATHFPYGIDLPDHKANGRFSNGKLIPDILAAKFNIKQFVPPFLQPNLSDQEIVTGVCFASAGSGYDDKTSLSTQAIPVSEQPNMFRKYIARLKSIVGDKKAMDIINNALVVISAGTNDMVLNFYTIPTRRLEYPLISGYHDFILKRLDDFIGELYSLGARNIAIAGLPPIGCLPIQMTAKFRNIFRFCLEQENKDSVVYNQKLEKLLPQIQASHTGSKILYADIYTPIYDMMQNPSKYGFTETKRGCCGTGFLETSFMCNVFSPSCPNHSEFLFFDAIHPSEATYNYIGDLLDTQIRGSIAA